MIFTDRVSAPTTPYLHLGQCADRHPSHPNPNKFTVSCPIYLYEYEPTCIKCIVFTWHVTVCILEHYQNTTTTPWWGVWGTYTVRRRVQGDESSCRTQLWTLPSETHQYHAPNTHRTNTCLQSHRVKPPMQKQLIVVWLFIDTQKRLVTLHFALDGSRRDGHTVYSV